MRFNLFTIYPRTTISGAATIKYVASEWTIQYTFVYIHIYARMPARQVEMLRYY